jgi:hypothetical protein
VIRAVLKAMRRRYMDVTLRSGPDLTVRIVERPGLWMTPEELAALSAALRQISARTLALGALTYGVFSGDPAPLGRVVITLVSRRDGTPIAFNALALLSLEGARTPVEVLHLGLVMVDPDERSKRLSWLLYGLTCFLIFLRRQFRPIWVSSVTQVPSVVGMVSEMFSGVWPGPRAGRRTLNHRLIARQIMAQERATFGVSDDAPFSEEDFVIRDAYRGGSDDLKKTWENAPKHRDAHYNALCEATLDYARGDDFLQIGQMDFAAMRRYLARDVPRGDLAGLLLTGAIVALQRLVLPVIHWADAGQQWATLRPAKGTRP